MNPPGSSLTTADYATLSRSGISRGVADAALRRVDHYEGAELMGRKANAATDYAGLIFVYRWPGDDYPREFRLQRDRPDYEEQPDGRNETNICRRPDAARWRTLLPAPHRICWTTPRFP
jgi:hypothetical protein